MAKLKNASSVMFGVRVDLPCFCAPDCGLTIILLMSNVDDLSPALAAPCVLTRIKGQCHTLHASWFTDIILANVLKTFTGNSEYV